MRYYNYEMAKRMKETRFDEALQKYFPDNEQWGGCAYFDSEKNFEFIELCRLSNVTQNSATWTHFATIGKADDGSWEVYTQFNGKNQNELWVYGYYKHFKGACHCCASDSFQKGIRKPIKVFE